MGDKNQCTCSLYRLFLLAAVIIDNLKREHEFQRAFCMRFKRISYTMFLYVLRYKNS